MFNPFPIGGMGEWRSLDNGGHGHSDKIMVVINEFNLSNDYYRYQNLKLSSQ